MIAPLIPMDGKRDVNYCNFCGKNDEEVRALLLGRASVICNECVFLCVSILEEKGIVLEGRPGPLEALSSPPSKGEKE